MRHVEHPPFEHPDRHPPPIVVGVGAGELRRAHVRHGNVRIRRESIAARGGRQRRWQWSGRDERGLGPLEHPFRKLHGGLVRALVVSVGQIARVDAGFDDVRDRAQTRELGQWQADAHVTDVVEARLNLRAHGADLVCHVRHGAHAREDQDDPGGLLLHS